MQGLDVGSPQCGEISVLIVLAGLRCLRAMVHGPKQPIASPTHMSMPIKHFQVLNVSL